MFLGALSFGKGTLEAAARGNVSDEGYGVGRADLTKDAETSQRQPAVCPIAKCSRIPENP